MRKTVTLLAVLAAMLVMAVPASAIQFGAPDGNNHPQVGLMVAKAGDVPLRRCTGTLIAPTVFLSAGHCTVGATAVDVWFSPGPILSGTYGKPPPGTPCGSHTGYPCTGSDTSGTPYTHSQFDGFASFPASRDLGVVVLNAAQSPPYASLASAGYLDTVKNGQTTFDIVGYGLQDALPPVISAQRVRYAGRAQMANTKSALTAGYNVQLTAAPGTGGALCDGDSGGPVFLAGTTTIVAVVSLKMSDHCMGGTLAYRTDTAESLEFINPFLP